MKLKDYLHLYLGCNVLLESEMYSIEGSPEKIIERLVSIGEDGYEGERHALYVGDFKPILRPLSDMTDAEINGIASIILQKSTTCFRIEWSEEKDFVIAYWKKEKSMDERYDFVEMGMHISNIGNHFRVDHVWEYIHKHGTAQTHEALKNSHELTRFLLSKHFDIFGLIENNLAIDATTMLNKEQKVKVCDATESDSSNPAGQQKS